MKQLWVNHASAGTETSNFADRIYIYVASLYCEVDLEEHFRTGQ